MRIAEFFEHTVLTAGRIAPHPVLYHYTTYDVAQKILTSQEFWSTAHDCTNDEAELISADSIVVEVAKACRKNATGTAAKVFDVFLAHYPDSMITELRTLYLICFSKTRDDQNQWKAYGDNSRGVCLGIKVLEEPPPINAKSVSATFEVDYSEASLRDWLCEPFRKVCSLLSRVQSSRNNCEEGLSALYRLAAYAAIKAKHEKWSSEKEVRLVTFARHVFDIEPKERVSATGKTIRYVPVHPRADGKLIAFDEIIIGSNRDTDAAREQFKILLATKGYTVSSVEYPKITVSAVPFSLES